MTTILRIDSSSRPIAPKGSSIEGSFSRAIADRIVARLTDLKTDTNIVGRDLIAEPISHITDETIKGYYTPQEYLTAELRAATAQSDELINELRDADAIIISAPIYNFSVPSALKAWIDQVVRIGHTFEYENGQFNGLLPDRPTFLALSYGGAGYAPGGPMAPLDFFRPYLTRLLNFIGLTSTEVITVEATTAPDAKAHLERTFEQIDALISRNAE